MSAVRLPIPLVAAALLAASAAHAADYPQPAPVYVPAPVIEEYAAWYLRGDIGFSNQQVRELFSEQDAAFASLTHVDKGFDAAPLFGLGIGYYFNDWLRFDITGEYRGKANFHGLDVGTLPGGGGSAVDRYTASKYEWTFMLNGYIDLGTWHNLTPFVGAGVGFTRNTITNFGDFSTCISTTGGCTGSDAHAADASKWNFAWALHAGLAYRVTKNFTVELAYRYIDLGNAITDNAVTLDGNVFPAFEFRHLTSHDVKLGVRFNFDAFTDCCSRAPQYYAPPPVYAPPPPYMQQPSYGPPLRSRG
jgi:opacity protein-like surface antigen